MNAADPAAQAVVDGLRAALVALAARGTLVFLLAYAMTRFVRSLTDERRHTLWLAALFLMAAVPLAQLVLPVVRIPVLAAAVGPVSPAAAPVPAAPGGTSFSPGETPGDGPGSSSVSWLPLAAAAAWAAGVVAAMARPVAGRIALGRMRRSRLVTPGPGARCRELSAAQGIRGVRAFAHPSVTVPFTCGTLHPVIFLPPSWRRWGRDRLEAVLLHELAHVKRGDTLANAAAQVACAVMWFNPLAWLARSMLLREAEASCDRTVLAHGIGGPEYALTIVDILRETGRQYLGAGWSTLGGRESLKRRIARILSPRPAPGRQLRRRAVTALAICLAAPLVLASVSLREANPLAGTWQVPGPAAAGADAAWREMQAAYVSSPGQPEQRLTWREDGTGSMAIESLADVPASRFRYTVEKRWKDAEGGTWFHVRATWSGMPFPLYTLIRLHPSGRLLEMTDSPVGYPRQFVGPPGDEKHQVYVRR